MQQAKPGELSTEAVVQELERMGRGPAGQGLRFSADVVQREVDLLLGGGARLKP